MEPVQGFLARYLCRRLLDAQVREDVELSEMDAVVQWLPHVWQHVNRVLETHGGSDVTVGTWLFLVLTNVILTFLANRRAVGMANVTLVTILFFISLFLLYSTHVLFCSLVRSK